MTTVLIADDEIVERQYLCRLFERLPGFTLIGQAENGTQAAELADRRRPDVIIMDINMPMNGLEAARLIRSKNPEQIIIINTAYADFEYARQALSLQLNAYLLKPATAEEVLSTVEGCLRQKNTDYAPTASVRAQLPYPYDEAEAMLQSLTLRGAALFCADSARYLAFLDNKQGWTNDYRLYLINTAFSLAQRLSRLRLPDAVLSLVDCEGCIDELKRADGESLRRAMDELFRRIALSLKTGELEECDPAEVVCAYIEKHYAEEITLEQLAGTVHLSPGYLSRLFHKKTGVTFRSYINRTRVENAARMLRASHRGVNDIALDCGFCNLSHFHRVFKEHTGMTPREARFKGKE